MVGDAEGSIVGSCEGVHEGRLKMEKKLGDPDSYIKR